MDEDKLKDFKLELEAADDKERETRGTVISRRAFIRYLAGATAAAAALLLARDANAGTCNPNTVLCTQPSNTCISSNSGGCNGLRNTCQSVNNCIGGTINSCSYNECFTSNSCGTGGATQNTCNIVNMCDQTNDCSAGNWCLGTRNSCDPNLNTCRPHTNHCAASKNLPCGYGNGTAF
jgi:hypothetical protein